MADEKIPQSLPEFISWLKTQNIDSVNYSSYIDRFLDYKARQKGIPFSGKFELTPLCNLDCKMCYVHLNKAQMQSAELLPVETWKSIAKSAIDMGMMKIEISGGECLTYPDFDELYLYLHCFGVEICVFTNGLLLDDKRIEFFKAHPPKRIQVSLYGESDDTYEAVTGHRRFETVLSNITKAHESGLPIVIAVTPNRYMSGKGIDIIKAVLPLGV
ncbi:MAG: radical SAM protein [Clostridia bacterium]|nr:radical SAM protein [Clostridia bacterium]